MSQTHPAHNKRISGHMAQRRAGWNISIKIVKINALGTENIGRVHLRSKLIESQELINLL
jgi:hypothetical protein